MFKKLVLLSALMLATAAAWFSVSGISQLFIGAPLAAMFMAVSLELGKLVGVSFLYRYWEHIAKPLKIYMTIGGVILMLITSVGIYGYLSAAYANAAVEFNVKAASVEQVQSQVNSLDQLIQSNRSRVDQLTRYREHQENRLNQLVDKPGFITQQRMVRDAESDLRNAQKELFSLISKKDSLTSTKTIQEGQLNTGSKLSTFYYVAKSLNVPLDTIVKWFILVIVVVFDPMSLALIMSYNALVKMGLKKKEIEINTIKMKNDEWRLPPTPDQVLQREAEPPSVEEAPPNELKQARPAGPAWWGTPMQREHSS